MDLTVVSMPAAATLPRRSVRIGGVFACLGCDSGERTMALSQLPASNNPSTLSLGLPREAGFPLINWAFHDWGCGRRGGEKQAVPLVVTVSRYNYELFLMATLLSALATFIIQVGDCALSTKGVWGSIPACDTHLSLQRMPSGLQNC